MVKHETHNTLIVAFNPQLLAIKRIPAKQATTIDLVDSISFAVCANLRGKMQKPSRWCPWILTAENDLNSFCVDSATTCPQSTFEGNNLRMVLNRCGGLLIALRSNDRALAKWRQLKRCTKPVVLVRISQCVLMRDR